MKIQFTPKNIQMKNNFSYSLAVYHVKISVNSSIVPTPPGNAINALALKKKKFS